MMAEKMYMVDVIERHQHGRYGKRFYFDMPVCGVSKKDVEGKAAKIMAGMTFDEINARCVDKKMKPWQCWHQEEHEWKNGKSVPIGMELVGMFFGFRIRICEGVDGNEKSV